MSLINWIIPHFGYLFLDLDPPYQGDDRFWWLRH